MASDAQIKANQQNSENSTGPKSEQGKDNSKMNAVKHGLTAESIIMPGEDPDEFRHLKIQTEDYYKPVGWKECELVERITKLYWRLRRAPVFESNIVSLELAQLQLACARRDLKRLEPSEQGELEEFVELFVDPEQFERAKSDEIEAQGAFDAATKTIGAAFTQDSRRSNAFTKVGRYERHIERSIKEAVEELRELQEDRKSKKE